MAIEKGSFEQTPGRFIPQLRTPGWVAATLILGVVLLAVTAGALVMGQVSGRPLQLQVPGITTAAAVDTVTVTGAGRVAATPDTIYTDIGAEAQQATLAQSLSAVASDMTKLTAALKGAGVADADMQTTSMNTWTRTNQYGSFLGYSANVSLRVRIRDVTKVNTILNAAATSIGNDVRLGQLMYDRTDITAQAPQARQMALAAAQERASGIAKLSNRQLGKITEVTETYAGYTGPGTYMGGYGGGGGQGGGMPQVNVGQGEVVVQLSVTYALN